MFNKNFYTTPEYLIRKMLSKVKGVPKKVLEPSAGKGDIIDAMTSDYYSRYHLDCISAIELDEELQATLRGKGIKLIDTDFLTYSGPDKFDLIIANPPFDNGEKHLLKAIEIMYRGEIVFLLNAETLRNPYTNTRKDLIKKLTDLNADIEYIQNAFKDAERPTGVEIALIYINIERNIEDDLFKEVNDAAEELRPRIEKNYEVSTGKTIKELVAEYNQVIHIGTETIIGYYRNYKKIGKYIGLNMTADKDHSSDDMTSKMQGALNDMLVTVRTDFWRKTLNLKEVRSRLTEKKQAEFEHQIDQRCYMDFTEHNIRQFVLNLISGYEKTLTEAVIEIFDKFTIKHAYSNGLYDKNIHYYNGWKTNKAFKVNKKVIIPFYGGYVDGPFTDGFSGKWRLDWNAKRQLCDIDIVMNYFDGIQCYVSISDALETAFGKGQSSKIVSTFFTITAYKKGTLHLTFNSEDILRRFNVAAGMGKGWLPHDYGKKAYKDFNSEEQGTVDSFEGTASYNKNLNRPLFASNSKLLRIAA